MKEQEHFYQKYYKRQWSLCIEKRRLPFLKGYIFLYQLSILSIITECLEEKLHDKNSSIN